MRNLLLIVLSLLLLLPNFIDKDINEVLQYDHREQFNPGMSYINSIDKLEQHIDSMIAAGHIQPNSVAFVTTITTAIRYRFFHGFSHFSLKENWIAAVAEKIFGYGLASKVKTEDIMQHPYAACSQQAMVMMDILRRKHIDYRSVGFPIILPLRFRLAANGIILTPIWSPASATISALKHTGVPKQIT